MSGKEKVSDEQLAKLIRAGIPQSQILQRAGLASGTSTVNRLRRIAKEIGVTLIRRPNRVLDHQEAETDARITEYMRSHGRRHLRVANGVILVCSDAHYWPDVISTAHRAFVRFCKEMRPRAVVLNGDGFDGGSISRFPRIGWDSKPTVAQELQVVEERLTEIEEAAGTKELYWPLGNHDARFETYLASNAPEYEGVKGFHLKDHFPLWRPCWSVWVNDNVVIKHRHKSGIHAPHNNTLWAGKTMVTGHLHSLKVMPISDYNGTRYGVDCGTLAQPYGPQFVDYTEDNPVSWRSGFVVLTFWRGRLLLPELAQVLDEDRGLVQFRGQVLSV